ncbi:50S ribosomal protein L6 [Gloeomargarita lithophora Alchichica-D10]|uniref:Large ribosomal subunit protein uL6 n=1 Tax=Gloeomargarita lithophora Alchichica-D10 TaxID=1188229 RepID=A0A1J0AEF5_9CYAN|nr:50S ribosomal protein L6 [Gloeomargarita lithophora]APB34326.1 50S ribosomal protein L6 [Gloeomargarita lithophora Alchichica-D10]
MSRIGKRPIPLPAKVSVTLDGQRVQVKGPKGELQREFPAGVVIQQQENVLLVSRANDSRQNRQLHGLCRTLMANMVEGVAKEFERKLEIQGVGYRAQMSGTKLVLTVGYSHPVEFTPPAGITLSVEDATGKSVNQGTLVVVRGIDKEQVGNLAARIRFVRPPEPYKGKGIRYVGEVVRRKEGKTTGKKK